MSGVQILSVTNMRLQVVRLGTVKFIPQRKRILNTVLAVGDFLISKIGLS